jgi:hypothetical protein
MAPSLIGRREQAEKRLFFTQPLEGEEVFGLRKMILGAQKSFFLPDSFFPSRGPCNPTPISPPA